MRIPFFLPSVGNYSNRDYSPGWAENVKRWFRITLSGCFSFQVMVLAYWITAFNRIIFAVIGRIIRQTDREMIVLHKLHQAVHKLSTPTAVLRAIVQIDEQRLDVEKALFDAHSHPMWMPSQTPPHPQVDRKGQPYYTTKRLPARL